MILGNEIQIMKSLLKTTKVSEDFDYYNKEEFFSLFKGKQTSKIPKYIKVIKGLGEKMRHDYKVKKKLFNDDDKLFSFLVDNVQWLLEKSMYEYESEEIDVIFQMIKNIMPLLPKKNADKIKIKLDSLLQEFLNQQDIKHPERKLKE